MILQSVLFLSRNIHLFLPEEIAQQAFGLSVCHLIFLIMDLFVHITHVQPRSSTTDFNICPSLGTTHSVGVIKQDGYSRSICRRWRLEVVHLRTDPRLSCWYYPIWKLDGSISIQSHEKYYQAKGPVHWLFILLHNFAESTGGTIFFLLDEHVRSQNKEF